MRSNWPGSGKAASRKRHSRRASAGDWDRFQIRNVGLAAQKRMAGEFGGDAQKIRADSANFIKRGLGLDTSRWSEPELRVFESFALVLAMIPGISRWNANEKQLTARIIVAKARGDEGLYLRLMQGHARMRAALIEFGL